MTLPRRGVPGLVRDAISSRPWGSPVTVGAQHGGGGLRIGLNMAPWAASWAQGNGPLRQLRRHLLRQRGLR
ncbi:hypothetical protein ACFONI_16265 [Aeromonas media]|uniref:hypothetical protein n=1 Tax=Aeromonas media TaxID=651 RepID=UPI00361375B1